MKFRFARKVSFAVCLLAAAANIFAQSGHSHRGDSATGGEVISLVATRGDGSTDPIRMEELFLYENGQEQRIGNLAFDPSPSRIVLLVDNSERLGVTVEALQKAAMEFAYEIFDGDQLYVLAYDEKAEIVQDWTDDAKKMEASVATFRQKGNPYLFDALHDTLNEILMPLMPGTRKTTIVVIGDGLDRGSKASFEKVLGELQLRNVTVYALQVDDRTNGVYRRNSPKPKAVIQKLTEGTGGLAFPFDKPREAAKFICDELRKNRYLLSYFPVNTSSYDQRTVLVLGNDGINIRTKKAQPPNIK
jgi:Ca-activated chloride channel family protein